MCDICESDIIGKVKSLISSKSLFMEGNQLPDSICLCPFGKHGWIQIFQTTRIINPGVKKSFIYLLAEQELLNIVYLNE